MHCDRGSRQRPPPYVGGYVVRGKLAAAIGKFYRLAFGILHVPHVVMVMHERDIALSVAKKVKRLVGGFRLFERILPCSFEVNRVGQDQARQFGQAFLSQNVLNSVFSRLCHPAIDLVCRVLVSVNKINLS